MRCSPGNSGICNSHTIYRVSYTAEFIAVSTQKDEIMVSNIDAKIFLMYLLTLFVHRNPRIEEYGLRGLTLWLAFENQVVYSTSYLELL